MRAVAGAAGVDVALVSYYFGNKDALFAATMHVPRRPRELIDAAFEEGAEQAGPRLVRMFLDLWEDPASGPALLAMFRSAASHEPSRRALSDFASKAIVGRYAAHLPDRSHDRSALAASQLVGVALLRYVIRVEPMASMSPEAVVRAVGPTVQHYLTGDITRAPDEADRDDAEPHRDDAKPHRNGTEAVQRTGGDAAGTFGPAPHRPGRSTLAQEEGGHRADVGA